MMNKKEALKLYGEVNEKQGEHNGRWEDEYSQESSSVRYMEQMISYAQDLNIDFDPDPLSYYNYYEKKEKPDYFNYDAMGFKLKVMICEKLETIILN